MRRVKVLAERAIPKVTTLYISEFRLAIDNYGVDKVMSQMDDETFWKLWSWFKNAQKQRHL